MVVWVRVGSQVWLVMLQPVENERDGVDRFDEEEEWLSDGLADGKGGRESGGGDEMRPLVRREMGKMVGE